VIIQCTYCGAPLDVGSGAAKVKCRYCDTVSVVRQTRCLEAETPKGWKPPPTWTAPAGTQAQGRSLTYHSHGGGRQGVPIALVILIVTGALAYFVVGPGDYRRLVGEWLSVKSCMVDANGDDVLDAVGLLGMPTSKAIPLTIVDGKDGKVLWRGGGYDLEARLICLGPTAFAVERPNFRVDLRQARAPDAVRELVLPDRIRTHGHTETCASFVTASKEQIAVSLAGQPLESCEAEQRSSFLGAGYADATGFSGQVFIQTEGGVTYVLTRHSPGTAFIVARALRGSAGPRPATSDISAERAFMQALDALPELWRVKLPYAATGSRGPPGLLANGHLITWGLEPGNRDAGGVLIGLNLEDGSLKYARPQGSPTWSRDVRELHTNGTHALAVWGFGIFAYDPPTGERVWRIGGR
jgi:LSD1 subclass zinc finger protein